MRVLMLSYEYPPNSVGGLGKHVMELVPELVKTGVEVHLVTPRLAGGLTEEAISSQLIVHRVDPPAGQGPDFFSRVQGANASMTRWARDLINAVGGFELIHAHDWLVGFSAIELKHAFRVPLVATIHATEYGRNHGSITTELQHAINHVEWWLTYEAWRVIACTDFMRREIVTALQCPADKIEVIPNGIDTSPYDKLEGVDLSDFRARYALPAEVLIFNVGRIVFEKGVQTLVEAAPRVLASVPEAKFVVAGSGGYLDYLRSRVAELELGDKLLFAGFISDEDRDRLFRAADVAVFPSLYEPFGIVALEAMAAKTPVIVSDVGGFPEVVENHETGLTVTPGNPDSLAWGILHTLHHPHWTQARVENAYHACRTRFSWTTIAEHTKRVYDQVITERQETDW